jgi:hypothetical protein
VAVPSDRAGHLPHVVGRSGNVAEPPPPCAGGGLRQRPRDSAVLPATLDCPLRNSGVIGLVERDGVSPASTRRAKRPADRVNASGGRKKDLQFASDRIAPRSVSRSPPGSAGPTGGGSGPSTRGRSPGRTARRSRSALCRRRLPDALRHRVRVPGHPGARRDWDRFTSWPTSSWSSRSPCVPKRPKLLRLAVRVDDRHHDSVRGPCQTPTPPGKERE